ncbi:MAG: M14 family metallopeptidase [Bacteroidota bacterium]
MLRRLFALAVLAVLVALVPAAAQPVPLTVPFTAPGTTGYDPAVPTPEQVLGHTIGERHTRPADVVRYVEAVAAASDRVSAFVFGQTYEGRRLVIAHVGRPDRIADLARVQAANRRLSDAPGSVSDTDLDALPVVAYMGYGVHGNESSATEAGLLLLYHLAAGQGPAVDAILDEALVLIDPMLNPDGRDRFVDWVNGQRGGVATRDIQDREHNEPWPNGRTNHYLFDLNRDWLPLQHVESRARMDLWHGWRPQLSTDYHEMGRNATYFFQPGVPSRTNPNTPALNQDLTRRIGEFHARALDRIGQLYYAEESFDDYYYGKGSTYPDVNGAVGILFEQASSRALKTESVNGPLDYGTTVRNQFATSLSSLEAAVSMRTDLLRHQRDFYAGANAFARDADVQGYVVATEPYPTRAAALQEVLQQHRIRVHDLAQPVTVDGMRFEPGEAFVVPVAQPQARLVKAVMERVSTFPDSIFYDVSTWTLPLAFGVPHGEVPEMTARVLGGERPRTAFPAGRLTGGSAAYAYAIPWGRALAPRALGRLQQAGVRVRLATAPFTADVSTGVEGGTRRERFDRGTLIVPVDQADIDGLSVIRLVQQAVAEDGVDAYALPTGLTPEGPDLGGPSVPVLDAPTIGLFAGPGTSVYRVGEVWHLLSERYRLPVSLLDAEDAARLDLDDYDVLVLSGFIFAWGETEREAVAAWVRGGGTLVTLGRGMVTAAQADWLDATVTEADDDSTVVPYEQRSRQRGAQALGGSIFAVDLDPTHPLAYGYGPEVALFKQGAFFLAADSSNAEAVVGQYLDEPRLSGYVSTQNLDALRGGAAVVANRMGRGRVIGIDGAPSFRAFWWGTQGLVANAVFFGQRF